MCIQMCTVKKMCLKHCIQFVASFALDYTLQLYNSSRVNFNNDATNQRTSNNRKNNKRLTRSGALANIECT